MRYDKLVRDKIPELIQKAGETPVIRILEDAEYREHLEKKLDEKYTCSQILDCLQEMEFLKFEGKGYVPTYTKNELTDDLHNAFGFNTSKEIIPIKKMKNLCAQTKKTDA